jgi:cell division protein sepF 1
VSIFKKISTKFIGVTPDDEMEESEVHEEEKKSSPVTGIGSRAGRRSETGTNVSSFPDFSASAGGTGNAVIDNVVAAYRMNVVVIEPQTFDDAQQVAVNLQKKKPVVLNFEKTEKSVASRIIDFISGTTYALNGDIKKISNNVFLCAPNNVNVSYSEEEHRLGDDMSFLNR